MAETTKMIATVINPEIYRTGEPPRGGDRVRLVDVQSCVTQLDEPAEPGEYEADDFSWGLLLLINGDAAIWCWPWRCELVERFKKSSVEA